MGNDDRQYSYCSCLKWFYRLSGSQDLRWALQIRKSLNDLKTKRRIRIRLKASGRSSPDLNWMVQLSAAGLWWHLSMVIHDFRQQSWRRNHWPVGWESSCPWYTYNRMAKYRELLKIRDSFLMPSTAKEKYWINLKLTLDIGFYITVLPIGWLWSFIDADHSSYCRSGITSLKIVQWQHVPEISRMTGFS